MSLDMGALTEPLSVAMHAGTRARLEPDETVLVMGAGAVGLLCAAVSRVKKARAVVIADIQPDRVQFAVDNGFADVSVVVPMSKTRPTTIEDKLAYAQEVSALIKGSKTPAGEEIGEVNYSFECTGVESCMQSSIYVSDPGPQNCREEKRETGSEEAAQNRS